jgi:disulfide oxidoreductase YuzD
MAKSPQGSSGKVKGRAVAWLPESEAHNYPAAESYLGLIYDPRSVRKMIRALRLAPLVEFKAKDIFRASQLSLLGVSNSHVEKNTRKIRKGVKLSPLLLVRDEAHRRVIIADGYHRLCAIYQYDEDAMISCRII